MLRSCCFALWVGLIVAVSANTSSGQESLPVLEYLGQRAARMAGELPPVPSSRDAWEQHRTELLKELADVLGLPAREPMKAAVTDKKQQDDLLIEEVAYLWAGKTYVSATAIRGSKTKGRQPAIVMPPGWLGNYRFLPYREFVESLAREGFLVLFIDDPRTGKRHAPYAGLYATASAAGMQVAGIQVFDALRGLDYLLTRADVDPGRIGIAGLGEGALQSYLAAVLEPRFQFVVAVGGTTTYQALVQATAKGNGPEDPSAFVAGILKFTDMDRVAACIAPRPVLIAGNPEDGRWPAEGRAQALRTMNAVYGLYDAAKHIHQVPGKQSDDMRPYISEITGWLQNVVLPSLKSSEAAPLACGKIDEDANFSMLSYLQQRIADQAKSLTSESTSKADCDARRKQIVEWLRSACALVSLKPAADKVVKTTETEGVMTEQLALSVDADFACPAILVRPAGVDATKRAGIVLSHDDRGCAASAKVVQAVQQLVSAGYWVIVPDHASVHGQSLQPLSNAEQPGFYGDEAAKLYGPADVVGLSPLALRVAENLAAFRHLAARPDVDPQKIVLAGLGIGGVDACLAGVLEERVAGVASIDATTMRDWALNVAPDELRFFHIMPYLPSILRCAQTDLDQLYAAVAPRPLVVVRLKDGWPRSGFDQVTATTSAIYKLQQAVEALLALGPRDVTQQLETDTPQGIRRQLISAARTLVPTPPQPGIVGNVEGLKSRKTSDSASGLIWVVAEMSGYDQEFVDDGYRLETWSFFNDNGDAQKGRLITPLIFKKQGDKYLLTGIGKTQTNNGAGVQTFPFEPVEGTDAVGDGHFFGWHTGDGHGKTNPGVAEFEDSPDALMIILTADGQMSGQKLKIGATYRHQSQYRRRYSVMAVSKK